MPSNKQWFETWFNHPFYLELYAHRNDADAQKLLDLVFSNLNLKPSARILDLGCGNGRHSIQMTKRGYRLTGLDLSPHLLSIAKQDAASQNLTVDFVEGDMRFFKLFPHFDAVFNCFTSFGFFDDDRENFSVFRTISEHLNSGGYFVFDYLNEAYIRQHLVDADEKDFGKFHISQKRRIEKDMVKKIVRINRDNEILEFEESVKLYPFETISAVLENFGFSIEKTWGNYNGDPLSADCDRIILIAKRK